MRHVRSDYNYQRFPKPAERDELPPRVSAPDCAPPFHQRSRTALLQLNAHVPPGRRDDIMLRIAKAGRGLCLMQQPYREYEIPTDELALRRNNLGMQCLNIQDYPGAFRNFMAAIAQDEDFALPHNNVGLLYLEIGDVENALVYLNMAIGLEPDLDIAYTNRALTLIEKEEFEAARLDLLRALELAPNDPIHYNNAGVLFLEVGLPVKAHDLFDAAVLLDPNNPLLYQNRGIALEEMGRLQQAYSDFRKAAELEDLQFDAEIQQAYG